MSEEEQEAIKETIKHLNRWLHIEDNGSPIQYVGLAMEGLKIEIKNAIDFIEKQRKNIEEQQDELELLYNNMENFISKDKIRDKIKELEDKKWELSDEQGCWCSSELLYQIDILNELLEEE